jgi:hypothetical protein
MRTDWEEKQLEKEQNENGQADFDDDDEYTAEIHNHFQATRGNSRTKLQGSDSEDRDLNEKKK